LLIDTDSTLNLSAPSERQTQPLRMAKLTVTLTGYEDGQPFTRLLDPGDRWSLHLASSISIHLPPLLEPPLKLVQNPADIPASKIGVGAVLWNGALTLVAALAELPLTALAGERVIELGAGVAAPGLTAARAGAEVIITDLDVVLPVLRANVIASGLGDGSDFTGPGKAAVMPLAWGTTEGDVTADLLSNPEPAFILAADCIYIDGDGPSPSSEAFCRVAATIAGPQTRVWVAVEQRAEEALQSFRESAGKWFASLEKLENPKAYSLDNVLFYELRKVASTKKKSGKTKS